MPFSRYPVFTKAALIFKDPLLTRNLVKSLSWRIIGSLFTSLIGWLLSGNVSVGITIGVVDFLSKIFIYYWHERLWQSMSFGLRSETKTPAANTTINTINLHRSTDEVGRRYREAKNGNRAFTVWLTGISGSGKSTLAKELEKWLITLDKKVYVLDGDNVRTILNNDLGFSAADRTENVRRTAAVSLLFNDAGVITIASLISPVEADRAKAMQAIGSENFIEVFVDAPLETCIQRDPKGLYTKALAGDIKDFTGLTSDYELPLNPALHLHTDAETAQASAEKIKAYLLQNGFVQ